MPGLPRVAAQDMTIKDGQRGPIRVKAGQTVLIATSRAAMDPVAYPRPELIDPNRPISSYTLLGHGLHYCFGARLVAPALVTTLKGSLQTQESAESPGQIGRIQHAAAPSRWREHEGVSRCKLEGESNPDFFDLDLRPGVAYEWRSLSMKGTWSRSRIRELAREPRKESTGRT